MSDVEKYWEAIRSVWPTPMNSWEHLSREHQDALIYSINILLKIIISNEFKQGNT